MTWALCVSVPSVLFERVVALIDKMRLSSYLKPLLFSTTSSDSHGIIKLSAVVKFVASLASSFTLDFSSGIYLLYIENLCLWLYIFRQKLKYFRFINL